MRIIKKVGAARVSRLTFLLVFILVIVGLLVKSCFVDSVDHVSKNEKIPTSIQNTRTVSDGKINVNQERYYYNLGLLPPKELPDIYQASNSSSIEDTPKQSEIIENVYYDKNDDINPFAQLELNINLDSNEDEIASISNEIPTEIENNVVEDETPELIEQPIIDSEIPSVDTEVEEPITEENFDDIQFEDNQMDDFSWDGGFIDDFDLAPLEPILFAPYIQTQEEYDSFNMNNQVATQEESDDFFSDFYIAGESDEALFDDGIYYLTLIVNGDIVGDVETKFEGSNYSIGVNSLYDNVKGLLSDYGLERLFNTDAEYYTIDELNALNVKTEIDVIAFSVTMEFDLDDMPVKYLPVSEVNKNSLINRNEKYGIADAIELKPSFLSFVSALTLSSSYNYGSLVSDPILRNTLNMNNNVSIGKIDFNFATNFQYSVSSTTNEFYYSASTWKGFYDIRDKDLRITFGNLGSYLGTNGTPVGFTIDKNYSYGDDDPLEHQFTKRYMIESDSTLYVYINDEEPITRKLRKGEYILKDFPLQQGANHIKVRIEPEDKNYPIILDAFDVPYDTRLLSKGDYTYGLSAAISKSQREDISTNIFTLPYIDGQWYDYDFSDFDTRFYLNVGVSNYFTLNSSFAFAFDEIKTTFEGVWATMAGPFSGKMELDFTSLYSPDLYTSISHGFETPIGDINATMSLDFPVWENSTKFLSKASKLNLSLGHTLKEDNFPPLNTSISATFDNEGLEWSTNFSSSYSPITGITLNSSLNIGNNYYSNALDFTFQIGIGLNILNNLTASHSLSSKGTSSMSLNYKPSNDDSIQLNIGGIQYLTPTTPVFNLTWQHLNNYYALLLRHNMANDLSVMNTTATISSALYYADGLFALNRNAASNFIIIRPEGELANNPISIGTTNSSNLNILNPLFGNVVYTLLSANAKNNLIMYGTKNSLYSSGASFSYAVNTFSRSGFSKHLSSPRTYTVSGVLLQSDGTPFEQYSSPVYKLLEDENGVEYLEPDEQLYLFTDLDGRFILSDVSPGTYLFDMSAGNNQWYGLYFSVPETALQNQNVLLLQDYQQAQQSEDAANAFDVVADQSADTVSTFGDELASDYLEIIELPFDRYEDEQVFWDTIFPPLDEEVTDSAFEDTAIDWQNALDDTQTLDQASFENDPAFADTAENWEENLDETYIPTVVESTNSTNPNYTYVP
ncbi:MAG: hypothetical protein ACPKNR_13585 [Pleomorphochaeta sp.]